MERALHRLLGVVADPVVLLVEPLEALEPLWDALPTVRGRVERVVLGVVRLDLAHGTPGRPVTGDRPSGVAGVGHDLSPVPPRQQPYGLQSCSAVSYTNPNLPTNREG